MMFTSGRGVCFDGVDDCSIEAFVLASEKFRGGPHE